MNKRIYFVITFVSNNPSPKGGVWVQGVEFFSLFKLVYVGYFLRIYTKVRNNELACFVFDVPTQEAIVAQTCSAVKLLPLSRL